MAKVNIAEYKNNGESFARFQNDLLNCLGESVFIPSQLGLCFHLLKCIEYDFIHKPGVHLEDVEKGCEDVKQLFISKFGIWEAKIITTKNPSAFDLFLFNLLDFERLPGFELSNLENHIKEDLEKRNQTLKFYSSTKYISEFKSEATSPRNHDEKTLHAFYIRNIEEQEKIINHLLHGVKSRALIRAKSSTYQPFLNFNSFYDRPYLTAFPNTEKYFDHREIDTVGHRLGPTGIKDGIELKKLFIADKDEFYKKLKVLFPIDYAINSIDYYLKLLQPLNQTRKELFKELIELFRLEKWYGFYALALSQVEGLFSEMLTTINPKLAKQSLPEKVKALRPSYKEADNDFDYYEFYIPAQRNKFMHSGIDENIMHKSYDLLYDLMHILSIYASLDAPIIKLNDIIKRRDADRYFDQEAFNEYFELVEKSLKHKDYHTIKIENETFEKDFLCGHIDLEYLATEFEISIPQSLSQLSDTIKHYTKFNNEHEFNLETWTEHFIKVKPQILVQELSGVWENYNEVFLKVDSYRYFLDKFEKFLPSMPLPAKEKLIALKAKCKSDLNKVKLIVEELKKLNTIN